MGRPEVPSLRDTVDDTNPALSLRTLNYGNYGIFLIMGSAGFISSTVRISDVDLLAISKPSVVISMVIRPLIWVITIITLLITPLVTTREPPSRPEVPSLRDRNQRRGFASDFARHLGCAPESS